MCISPTLGSLDVSEAFLLVLVRLIYMQICPIRNLASKGILFEALQKRRRGEREEGCNLRSLSHVQYILLSSILKEGMQGASL